MTGGRSLLSRREALRLGAAALAASAAGCAGRESDRIAIAVQPWCGYQFMRAAVTSGLVTTTAELRPYATAIESAAAIERGEVDGAGLTFDQAVQAVDRGTDLVVVLIFNVSAGADVVLVRPGIATLQELKGRRIAVEATTLGVLMLECVLQAAGLQRADVEVVPMTERHVMSWPKVQPVDAVITYEPGLTVLQRYGLVPIFDSRALPQTIFDVLAVRREALERAPQAVDALVAAHFHGLRLWRDNPIDMAYRLAPLMEVRPAEVRNVFKGLDLPDADYNRHYLAGPSDELVQATRRVIRILRKAGQLRGEPDLTRLFTADHIPRRRD